MTAPSVAAASPADPAVVASPAPAAANPAEHASQTDERSGAALSPGVTRADWGMLGAAGLVTVLGLLLLLWTWLLAWERGRPLTVAWQPRGAASPATTAAQQGAASTWTPLPLTDQEDIATVNQTLQRIAARGDLNHPAFDALAQSQTRQLTGPAGEIPRENRWQIYFPEGLTVTDYALQLDSLGIELGVVMGTGFIEYVRNVSQTDPQRRSGPVAEEKRLYLTWTRGDLVEADRTLLSRAKLEAADKIVLQFFPAEVESKLAELESKFENRPAAAIFRTQFGVRRENGAYVFYVREQIPR